MMSYDGTINVQLYRDIFQDQFLPLMQHPGFKSRYIFQQDLAKPHTANIRLQQNDIPVLDCVPKLPDINHI